MTYGNNSFGFYGVPDNRHTVADPTKHTHDMSLAYTCGSRQGGYYHTATTTYSNRPKTTGRYLGNGQYIEE